MDDFKGKLRAAKFRATPGRVALLRALWSARNGLTVEELAGKLDLNVATMYRALNDLAEAGLVLRGIHVGEERAAHFSYPRAVHHHHMVCSDCGFIRTCATC